MSARKWVLPAWTGPDSPQSPVPDCDHEYTPNLDGTYEWCQKCDSMRPVAAAT
ncbi:MAG: hypothetical protein ACLP52_25930 [Streptosporangiaceae bacterium]